jgi:hypothetical protein
MSSFRESLKGKSYVELEYMHNVYLGIELQL